jgi:hypothetical protein
MAFSYKTLGQSAPLATTETTLYTVPGAKYAITSTLRVTNRGGSSTTFRIAVVPGGGATSAEHYVIYDLPIPANDSWSCTEGWTLATTDKIKVYAGNGNLSFSLFGKEADV